MEITAPGGNLEKIRYAVLYGADAVYCAYSKFGLRAFAGNLDQTELLEAIRFCHSKGVKLYLTLNIYARNEDFSELKEFIIWLGETAVDGLIISDPGVFSLVQEHTNIPIHISTQANITNTATAAFWHKLGAKRIIPARELSFAELKQIKQALPHLEIESFIHGAMCISWSGRCLLSAALNNRSANYGECTHPCRWNWALTEESRPGQYFPVQEDQYGTYVLNSKDLCLLDDIPMLKSAGISSGKIEGRMKSLYYVAQLCRIYKRACFLGVEDTDAWAMLHSEIEKVSHRPYYRGFFDGFDQNKMADSIATVSAGDSVYQREWQFCAKNISSEQSGLIAFDCLSKISAEDEIDLIFPQFEDDISLKVSRFIDSDGNFVSETKPNQRYALELDVDNIPEGGIIRKCIF